MKLLGRVQSPKIAFLLHRYWTTTPNIRMRKRDTSGALQARLIWVLRLDLVVYVARPVEFVCCDHLDVPKSPIWEDETATECA